MFIFLKENDFCSLFKIEKSNLRKPIEKEIIIKGDITPHEKSRANYLLLKTQYQKAERGNSRITSKELREMKDTANLRGYECPYCKQHLKDYASVDHKTPFYYGGESNYTNIQITCGSCNHSKGALNPITTPKTFQLFKERRESLIPGSCLEILIEALQRVDLDDSEKYEVLKLKGKEEAWREARDAA